MKRLLIVASVPCEKYHCQYGGATVLVKNMLDYMDDNSIKYGLIVTNKFVNKKTGEELQNLNRIHYLLSFIFRFLFYDTILFQYSDHAVVYLYPGLLKFVKCFGKKVVLRKFGGSFDQYLNKCNDEIKKRVIKSLKRTDLIFFETKDGIEKLKNLIGEDAPIIWLPNIRKPSTYTCNRKFSKKLVFMSHIRDEKGISEILNVAKQLPSDYSIDLYGAIKEDKYLNFDWEKIPVKYHGQITSEQVMKLLPEYSVLLLPSYREGYPGIIIEAMSLGIPSIATNVGGIPEIITSGVNGVLVNAKSVEDLMDAILSINEENYSLLSDNAYNSFQANFNSEKVNKRIIDKILSI